VYKPQRIVEIGSEDGKNTKNILSYCSAQSAHLDAIDPNPLFDAQEWQERYPYILQVHQAHSLEVLPRLPRYDTVLIDGDHNWYTVFQELRCIEQHMQQRGTGVLVLMHDVDWPYSRRDLYYNPADIPEEYRQSYTRGGLMLGENKPIEDSGLNQLNYHATKEGGERNGVLAAVEDFLKQSKYTWKFIGVPGFHGLGILAPQHLLDAQPALNELLLSLGASPPLASHLQLLAKDSIRSTLAALRRTEAVSVVNNALMSHIKKLVPHKKRILICALNRDTTLSDFLAKENYSVTISTPDDTAITEQHDIVICTEEFLGARKDINESLRNIYAQMHTGGLLCILSRACPSLSPTVDEKNIQSIKDCGWLQATTFMHPGISFFWKAKPVDIVIPIHDAYHQTVRCIESVLKHTNDIPHNILLIDDQSSDARMHPYLQSKAQAHAHVSFIVQSENRGFVRTANKGLSQHTEHDVVLLNSDTEVTEAWLPCLIRAAYEQQDCASVIPLSNEASIYSLFQEQAESIIEKIGLTRFAQLITENSQNLVPEIPTAVGFCMFLKRDALDEIDIFDEAYGMGYGEENDWCMRARRAGYKHYLADDCFVYHEGHVSMRAVNQIQEEQTTHPQNEALLQQKYPEYRQTIERYLQRNKDLRSIREHYAKVLIAELGTGKKRIAHLLHSNPFVVIGGTEQHVQDLLKQGEDEYCSCVIFPQPQENRLIVVQYADGLLHYSHFPYSLEEKDLSLCQAFEEIVESFHIDLLHIHHCMRTSFGFIDSAKKLGIPVIYNVHDYYALSPEYNLLRRDGTYHGVPKDDEYYDQYLCLTYGKWRTPIRKAIDQVDYIVAPSNSALAVFDQVYGDVGGSRYVIEHGTDPVHHMQNFEKQEGEGPVCFLGHMNRHAKGRHLVTQVALELVKRGQEVVFLGTKKGHWPTLEGQKGIQFFGPYHPTQLFKSLQEIHPKLICLFSNWPETFSYVLSETWTAGIPAYVTDIGALGERMRREKGGRIAPTFDPVLLAEDICTFLESEEYQKAVTETQRINIPTRKMMWQSYQKLYRSLLASAPAEQ